MLTTIKKNIRKLQSVLERITSPSTSKVYEKALKLGLFNAQWYKEHYGSFPHDYAAFKDYLEKGSFSNVNPSANFDTEFYNRRNLDIYLSGHNPLLHYIYHGRFENRQAASAQARWNPSDKLLPAAIEGWDKQKVAVVLHIYYADFVSKFAECLSNFPCSVDVFVTAGNADIAKSVTDKYNDIKTVGKVRVAIAENTGRNFGPFLINFSKELLNYDLMCHVHSKKSLYSGREQTQWFDYLNQYLLKDEHVVKSLLRLFKERPDFGIYYPTSFWMMPSWVNHWTCNKSFAKPFCESWGLEIESNFLNYPVGGMFWARPEALSQWLDVDYAYSDFPTEPLPNDGSYLHAMERVLGLLVEKNNYKQFFYYPPLGCFTEDKTYITASYYKSPIQLRNELSNAEIVSFDVFDTVLRRKYFEPDYAKLLLAKHLLKENLITSTEKFISDRNNAELVCRKRKAFKGDVDIFEVYQCLAESYSFISEDYRKYAQLEFQFDLEQCLPKDELVNIASSLHDAGKEIWFITDIYYTKEQIMLMLKKIGIAFPYTLYVSSDLQKRKDTGDMWKHIKSILEQDSRSYLHVGDNVRSDAQICGDYGLANLHILNPEDKWSIAQMPMGKTNPLDEKETIKWGRMKSNFGRFPFFGE